MNATLVPIPLWILERVPASENIICFLKISFELFTLQSSNKIFNEKTSDETYSKYHKQKIHKHLKYYTQNKM